MTDATDVAMEKARKAFDVPYGSSIYVRLKAAIEAYQAALPKGELAERLLLVASRPWTNDHGVKVCTVSVELLRAAASLLGGGVSEGVVIERCNYEAVMHHLQADGALDRRMLCELLAARPPESGRE